MYQTKTPPGYLLDLHGNFAYSSPSKKLKMGYYIQAFIGESKNIDFIKDAYGFSVIQKLKQNLSLIMLTEELFAQITNSISSENIKGFEYLTLNIEKNILEKIANRTIGYIEADYFGGEGTQSAIIWKGGVRSIELKEENAINSVLKYFGVIGEKGKDEFDTLSFGLLKSDRSWDSF